MCRQRSSATRFVTLACGASHVVMVAMPRSARYSSGPRGYRRRFTCPTHPAKQLQRRSTFMRRYSIWKSLNTTPFHEQISLSGGALCGLLIYVRSAACGRPARAYEAATAEGLTRFKPELNPRSENPNELPPKAENHAPRAATSRPYAANGTGRPYLSRPVVRHRQHWPCLRCVGELPY